MSEHAWVSENLAAYVAGGLEAAEAERVEAHAAECQACAAELRQARGLDQRLDSLFAVARPEPALEDRLIRAIRTEPRRRQRHSTARRLVWGAAATVALGITGAGVSQLVDPHALPFPGMVAQARLDTEAPSGGTPRVDRQWSTSLPAITAEDAEHPTNYDVGRIDSQAEGAPDNRPVESATPEKMAQAINGQWSDNNLAAMVTDGTSNNALFGRIAPNAPTNHFGFSVGNTAADGEGWKLPNTKYFTKPAQTDGRAPTQFDTSDADLFKSHKSELGYKAPSRSNQMVPATESESDDESKKKKVDAKPSASYFAPAEHKAQVTLKETGKSGDNGKLGGETTRSGARGFGLQAGLGTQAPQGGRSDKGPEPPTTEPMPSRKVIRSGNIEFEIESFDSAAATVTKLVTGIKGAFVATVNSDKLPNGKVKGSLVVRVPPDQLDGLVLDLRKELGKGGELKGLRIGSQDITKQYTDLESRLKAAKTMQERLLKIIQDGKGEIKQLLEAEKELGVWRTKIEEFEGEIRYYSNMVALSTLTVTLVEKEIRSAADIVEREVVDTGIEVEDVDKAREQTLAAVSEAKGRVIKAEMKQYAAGQFNATLTFEVPADKAGPIRDRLRQIGNMVRLEINRTQQAEGGQPTREAKIRRGDTQFAVSLYNVATVAPRETATVQVAATDVPTSYRSLQDALAKTKSRVIKAQLNEQDRSNITAELHFEVRRADEATIQAALAAAGEQLTRNVVRSEQTQNVTDAKVQYQVSLINAARIPPRETITLGIEVPDVEEKAAFLAAQVKEAGGRIVGSQVGHERSGRLTARLVYDVPLTAAASLAEQIKKTGTVRAQQSTRNPQAPEGKLAIARLDVTLSNAELIVPKDDGLWPSVRSGLATSVKFLSFSLSWIVVGLCVVLPWAVVGYGLYRLGRRLFGSPAPVLATTATPPASAPASSGGSGGE